MHIMIGVLSNLFVHKPDKVSDGTHKIKNTAINMNRSILSYILVCRLQQNVVVKGTPPGTPSNENNV